MATTTNTTLVSTDDAAKQLGISVSQFRRIVADAGIAPAEIKRFRIHGQGQREAHLWAPRDLGRLKRRKAVKVAQSRKGGAPRITDEARAEKFVARYGEPRAALPAAAEALFSLNRYTRWDSCSDANREEIRELKDRLVPLLHALGFTDRVTESVIRRPGKGCWDCGGDDGHKGDGCERCESSGWHRYPVETRLLAFTFTVGGQRYSWIVDAHLVPDVKADEASGEAPRALDAAINMSRSRFAEAKALIRWVLAAELKSDREIDETMSEGDEESPISAAVRRAKPVPPEDRERFLSALAEVDADINDPSRWHTDEQFQALVAERSR